MEKIEMHRPIVASNKPVKVTITKGEEYYFVSVGNPIASHSVTVPMQARFLSHNGSSLKTMAKRTYANASIPGTRRTVTALITNSMTGILGKRAPELSSGIRGLPL
jgi:hypothetical protein